MFLIEGHEYFRASDASSVALYIGGDVFVGTSQIFHDCEALRTTEQISYKSIRWQQSNNAEQITVKCVCPTCYAAAVNPDATSGECLCGEDHV